MKILPLLCKQIYNVVALNLASSFFKNIFLWNNSNNYSFTAQISVFAPESYS